MTFVIKAVSQATGQVKYVLLDGPFINYRRTKMEASQFDFRFKGEKCIKWLKVIRLWDFYLEPNEEDTSKITWNQFK